MIALRDLPMRSQPAVKRPLTPLVAYVATFFLAWTLYVYLVYPQARALGTDSLAFAIINQGVRLPIWILPVFVYARYVNGVNPLTYLKLASFSKRAILITLAVVLLDLLSSLLRYGMPDLSHANITWNTVLGSSLAVGLVEEIPFRGLLLQDLQERYGSWIGIIVSSLLFLLIHFPGWLLLGLPGLYTIVFVFVFGCIMSLLFKYTQSLWSPIIAHSFNDMLSVVIFRV